MTYFCLLLTSLPPSLLVCGPHLWLWALQGFSVCELEQVSAHRRMSAKFVRLAERDFSGSSHVGEAAQGCSATAGEAFHPDAQQQALVIQGP